MRRLAVSGIQLAPSGSIATRNIRHHANRSSSSSQRPLQSQHAREWVDDLDVGELEGTQIKIEPLRRTGEDLATMRARLTC